MSSLIQKFQESSIGDKVTVAGLIAGWAYFAFISEDKMLDSMVSALVLGIAMTVLGCVVDAIVKVTSNKED